MPLFLFRNRENHRVHRGIARTNGLDPVTARGEELFAGILAQERPVDEPLRPGPGGEFELDPARVLRDVRRRGGGDDPEHVFLRLRTCLAWGERDAGGLRRGFGLLAVGRGRKTGLGAERDLFQAVRAGQALRNGVRLYFAAASERISPAAGAADVPPTRESDGEPSLLPNQTPSVSVSVQAKHHASRRLLLDPVFQAAVPSNPARGSEVSIRMTVCAVPAEKMRSPPGATRAGSCRK